jgi:hypothetical protein
MKLLILLIIVIIVVSILFFAKITNFSLDDILGEPVQNTKKSSKELSEDEVEKVNDSINQREERIKALKEVGKKLGG